MHSLMLVAELRENSFHVVLVSQRPMSQAPFTWKVLDITDIQSKNWSCDVVENRKEKLNIMNIICQGKTEEKRKDLSFYLLFLME